MTGGRNGRLSLRNNIISTLLRVKEILYFDKKKRTVIGKLPIFNSAIAFVFYVFKECLRNSQYLAQANLKTVWLLASDS